MAGQQMVISAVVALVAAVALLSAPEMTRRAVIVVTVGAAAGWLVGEVDLRRYTQWPPEGDSSSTTVGGIWLLFVASAALAAVGNPPVARLGPALSVGVLGAYLCLPETGAIRLLPGPLAVAAAGVVLGRFRPLGASAIVALAGLVGWISLVDGQTRPASVIGALGSLASLLVLRRGRPSAIEPWSWIWPERPTDAGWRALLEPTVLMVTVAICSRGAGLLHSARSASLVVLVALTAGWSLVQLGSPSGPSAPSDPTTRPAGSEQL